MKINLIKKKIKKEKGFIYTSEYNKPIALLEKNMKYTPKIPNKIPPIVAL